MSEPKAVTKTPARKSVAASSKAAQPVAKKSATPGTATVAKKPGMAKAVGSSKMKIDVSPEQRYQMIAEAAYFRAEKRGFIGGDSGQDWIEAEAEIDSLLKAGTAIH
jgi:hypothetical protein